MSQLWNQLERAARLRGVAPAIHCGAEAIGWQHALDRAGGQAAALRSLGVTAGARFAFISPNSIAYMLMPFAADCLGAAFVPLNSRLSCAELVDQLRDADPVVLIAAEPFVALAREAAQGAGVPLAVLGEGALEDEVRFDRPGHAGAVPAAKTGGEPDLLAIYYTGGTTGRAKGVMLQADPGFSARDLSSLHAITYGGSPITQPALAAALAALPGVRMYQVYGQTEGGPTISILGPQWHSTEPDNAHRLRSAGKPLPLTDIRIVHPDGTACARGETGEITVRGPGPARSTRRPCAPRRPAKPPGRRDCSVEPITSGFNSRAA